MKDLNVTRRRFLKQTFAFSALASLRPARLLSDPRPSDPAAADLLLIGDWGFDAHHEGQTQVAAAMQRYAREQRLRAQALLFLGDNWYGALEGGARSPRWTDQFEKMYPAEAFGCPAYAVLGNHDYQRWPHSKVDAELEYAASGKSRWTMPARWYRFTFPEKNPLITFLALDSNVPARGVDTMVGLDFTLTEQDYQRQLTWLQSELQKPRVTPFLVVMAHHPVYSDGPHGDHPVLIRDWDPLLRQHKVDVYLAGHDHDLQHLEFEGHPTSFFLSGAGGADLYDLKIDPAARGPFAKKIYGFSHISVTENEMALRHVDSSVAVLHEFRKSAAGNAARTAIRFEDRARGARSSTVRAADS
jgi:tartrate-resistant acid phosphatase type 5